MFVRRKKNRLGSVSVVIVSKERGRFRKLQTIGVSANEDEIKRLYPEGQLWIREHFLLNICGKKSCICELKVRSN